MTNVVRSSWIYVTIQLYTTYILLHSAHWCLFLYLQIFLHQQLCHHSGRNTVLHSWIHRRCNWKFECRQPWKLHVGLRLAFHIWWQVQVLSPQQMGARPSQRGPCSKAHRSSWFSGSFPKSKPMLKLIGGPCTPNNLAHLQDFGSMKPTYCFSKPF